MSKAVYNSAIGNAASNSLRLVCRVSRCIRIVLQLSALVLACMTVSATDWSTPEQNLARKIVAVTGPSTLTVAIENRSSMGKRDSDIVENGLRNAMQAVGLRLVAVDQASTSITISLSENPTSYVWIAQIHGGDAGVVMVAIPREEGSGTRDSLPMTLRKMPLYAQDLPILDVVVLEEAATPTRIAVLDPEKLSWYRERGGRWQPEQALAITHSQPWPRDLRGRLISRPDHSLEVYLPGVICTAAAAKIDCRQGDDPWPLLPGGLNGELAVFPSAGLANGASTVVPQTRAFFAPTRNFFTGVLTPPIRNFTTLPKFFSAAPLPQGNNMLWLLAGTDGRMHVIDGSSDQVANVSWGSDLASVKTACGAGWQVLASSAGDQADDSIRGYEFPDRDPVAISPATAFDGAVTALWTESRGDTAVAVSRNRNTGTYEAFRLAMACGQ